MARHSPKDDFRLTPAIIIRLLIFGIIVFALISYFSQTPSLSGPKFDPTLSVEEFSSTDIIPKISQIIPESDIIIFSQKLDWLKNEINLFPQKQIEEIKRSVIQSVYDDLMKKQQ